MGKYNLYHDTEVILGDTLQRMILNFADGKTDLLSCKAGYDIVVKISF